MINVRGLAVIAVLCIHTVAINATRGKVISSENILIMIDALSRFAVPVFFVSSGFGISSIYQRYSSTKEFYKSRLKLLPDFIFWTVLYFLASGFSFTASNVAKAVIGKSYYHMYFIPALLICYFIFPIIQKFLANKFVLIILISLGLLIQFLNYTGIDFGYVELIGFVPYFLTGIFFEKNRNIYDKLKNFAIPIFIIGLVILLAVLNYDLLCTTKDLHLVMTAVKPTIFIYSVGIVLVFTKYFGEPTKVLHSLDRNSMNIYYVHPIILAVLLKISSKFVNFEGIIMFIIFVVMLLVISYVISILINEFKKIIFTA